MLGQEGHDTRDARRFYGNVFGWKHDDRSVPGGMAFRDDLPAGSLPLWIPYSEVSDCDASTEAAVELGARVLTPPSDSQDGEVGTIEIVDVIVVGADPAGLLVAGDLAETGIDVVVLERRGQEQSNLTRAFVVGPRTLEQFDARGIADELVATGSQLTSMRLYRRLWVDFASLPTRFPYQLITPQYETEAALRARAVRAGARFEWRTEVTGVTQADSRVLVTASGRRWQASYVVGADGSHSAVREALGEPFPGGTAVRVLPSVRYARGPRLAPRRGRVPGRGG